MIVHPKIKEFDDLMEALFHEVDHELEAEWGDAYDLHPVRPAAGVTENPEADGLFEVSPNFTPGFGSDAGRGYLVRCRVRTLAPVSEAVETFLIEQAAIKVKKKLPKYFPDRKLRIVKDGKYFKIVGDFTV
jgi:hypothetical protein